MITTVIYIPGRIIRRIDRYIDGVRRRGRYSENDFEFVSAQCELTLIGIVLGLAMLAGAYEFSIVLRFVCNIRYRHNLVETFSWEM